MFVYSLKGSTVKFFCILLLSVLTLTALIVFVPQYQPTAANTLYLSNENINYSKIRSNDDRIAFLAQFGWTVNEKAVEEQEVTIPDEFDSVFLGYNDIQRQQGLDLSKYKKKKMMRYTYEITNYDGYKGTVYANMLVYRNKVVGGDICSEDINGFVTGFSGK
ncbi:MAG: DUF4830 domain-containing protein [Ruminococcaceae bacterium]|nr:DUF4830 domain-containing protein [Oscillospiraceae bacterium]